MTPGSRHEKWYELTSIAALSPPAPNASSSPVVDDGHCGSWSRARAVGANGSLWSANTLFPWGSTT